MIFAPAVVAGGVLIRSGPAAFVETGSAVPRIVRQIRAEVASRTIPAEKPRIGIAGPTLGEAFRLLFRVLALAEGFAGVGRFPSPGRFQSHGTQKCPGEHGPQTPQGFPARKGLFSDRFGKFIPFL
jgi:hypothetical protein